ncbi:hypothetical protein [Streptomyces sp. SBT349]|uniref:hypothetical protein n=1 Tax=Streptomyces sp. SBT349 TaxID=1580539 RepID=UPI00066C8BAF|nr:hypothetical protein [Streptomyces sp. SBT349]
MRVGVGVAVGVVVIVVVVAASVSLGDERALLRILALASGLAALAGLLGPRLRRSRRRRR